jgi:hypothetical protein
MFFSPQPDGTFTNSYTKFNGVTNTLHLTGTTVSGSNCITVNSSVGLAVGQEITDVSSWTTNPGGQGLFDSKIASLTACGAGQIQMTTPAGGATAGVADNYLVTVCGVTAYNTKKVSYSVSTDPTTPYNLVTMTYPKACYDVPPSKLSNLAGSLLSTVAEGFVADLTPGSKCLSNLAFPVGTLGTSVLAAGYYVEDQDGGTDYFMNFGPSQAVVTAIPGTCAAGQIQLSANSSLTGVAVLQSYNLPAGTGYSTFSFYASMTSGSPCITPVLPPAASGYNVADSKGAVTAAAGAGVTLVAATGSCASSGVPYMLSEAAGAAATAAESFVIIPHGLTATCILGMCFDGSGNPYSGVPTCPTGTAALTAQTEVDTLSMNTDGSRIWASQSADCTTAFGTSDASLTAHCGAGQVIANTATASSRAMYAQTNTGCAACFQVSIGEPADYPANGCVGYGNVTCTLHSNNLTGPTANVVMLKQ